MEISDYQIAAALLELPSLILSDRFCYGNPGSLTAFRNFMTEQNSAQEDTEQMFDGLANERDRANQQENPSLYPDMTDWLVDNSDSDSDDENAGDETPDGNAVVPRAKGPLPVPRASLGHIQRITLCGGLADDAANNANNPKRSILVPSAALFLFRGPALHGINYIEYLACLMFENKSMPKKSRSPNFKTPAHFAMDNNFEGRYDCRHSIRLKQHPPFSLERNRHIQGKNHH
jgi:hypothetical protein